MKNILAFGASSSKKSINKAFASYVAKGITNSEIRILDLNDFEMPIYSIDRENDDGIPTKAKEFKQHIRWADGIIVSFAEHNGAYSVAFKNVFDWVSRMDNEAWEEKPMFLLATSPGARGAQTVLDIAVAKFSRSTNVPAYFSLPSFRENFDNNKGIINQELNIEFKEQLSMFIASL